MPRPSINNCAPFYHTYIDNTTELEPLQALEHAYEKTTKTLSKINSEKSLYKYAPEKWSIKEIVQHLIDTERIFAYRALSIARGEIKMTSFDQDIYVKKSNADYRDWNDIAAEMNFIRKSNILLFKSFDNVMLNNVGEMANHPATVNALGFIIAGHQLHHVKVIEEKYL